MICVYVYIYIYIWKSPKTRGPKIDPKRKGFCYKDTPKTHPQFIETAILIYVYMFIYLFISMYTCVYTYMYCSYM